MTQNNNNTASPAAGSGSGVQNGGDGEGLIDQEG